MIYHLSRAIGERDIEWVGIDDDERAIAWAKLINGTSSTFIAGDICNEPAQTYDSATLVEVAEHIEPAHLDHFVSCIARMLKPGGRLLVTVPHANQKVQPKHFQHFSFSSAEHIFKRHFDIESIWGFDKKTWVSKWLRRLTLNRKLILQPPVLTDYFVSRASMTFATEAGVSRILMRLRKVALR